MNILDNIASYWKVEDCFEKTFGDSSFFIIYGFYNYLHSEDKSRRCVGLCWGTFPMSHNKITPIEVPITVGVGILNGLLQEAYNIGGENKEKQIQKVMKALNFLTQT